MAKRTEAFAITEDELSADAQAILAYARKWGEPFTRLEITDVAPGAAWDPMSRYPRTMAKLDPIRELVRAGLVEVSGEAVTRPKGRRGGNVYKIYRLTEQVRTLADLLTELEDGLMNPGTTRDVGAVRAEIMTRFGKL